MEYRTLEVNVISAKDLNDVNFFTKMDVYTVVWISGDPQGRQKTKVDRDGGKDPTWNSLMKFNIDESAARQNNVTLVFQLRCDRNLGDKDIGEVHVPIKELLEAVDKPLQYVTYQVRKPSGRPKGVLNISYKFGERFTTASAPEMPKPYEAVTSYLAPVMAPSSSYQPNPVMQYAPPENAPYPQPNGYPPQQPVAGYGYPPHQPPPQPVTEYGYPSQQPPPQPVAECGYQQQPVAGYGYPHQQPVAECGYAPQPVPYPPPYGGYPPPPPHQGYGYPPQPGYGYPPQQGYGYPPVQQPAAKKKNNKLGMGLGAGLLGGAIGGLLIGDMISDAGSGFGDCGGF